MRHLRIARSPVAIGLGLLAGLATSCAGTPPTINLESEPTADGLYEVTGIDADEAWVQPDVDMARYSKIIIEGIEIEYRPGGERRIQRLSQSQRGPFEVTEPQRERFHRLVEEELIRELSESRRFGLADAPSAEALRIHFELLDLISYLPPDSAGPGAPGIMEYGEATLVMELRESKTGKVIFRLVDRRAAEVGDRSLHIYDRVGARPEPRRMFQKFAEFFRQRLDDAGELRAPSPADAHIYVDDSSTTADSGVE